MTLDSYITIVELSGYGYVALPYTTNLDNKYVVKKFALFEAEQQRRTPQEHLAIVRSYLDINPTEYMEVMGNLLHEELDVFEVITGSVNVLSHKVRYSTLITEFKIFNQGHLLNSMENMLREEARSAILDGHVSDQFDFTVADLEDVVVSWWIDVQQTGE